MNNEYITHLYQNGKLTDIDIHFAKFITGLSKNDDPDIFLAAALVSNATGNGDAYLDLVSVAEKPIFADLTGEGTVKGPKLSGWSQKLSQSPVVGSPGDFRPLILDKKNRLYLYRYWDYERKLSESIINRSREDIRGQDLILLKDGLKRLFPQNTGPWERRLIGKKSVLIPFTTGVRSPPMPVPSATCPAAG